MIHDALQKLELDSKEIQIYLRLLRLGTNRASNLASQFKLPRTTTQNILNRLEEKELITRHREKNTYLYTAVSPKELPQILELRRRKQNFEFNQAITELKTVVPELTKMMHLNANIPRVHLYRGREAARKLLFDTLTSKTELKDFANIDAMFQQVQDINDEYVAEREKTDITKRSLLLDTPFARQVYESGQYSSKSHKGYKWINGELYPFTLEMNIYDGKVSYLTYVEEEIIGVLIENDTIYNMHNSMWNLIWNSLPFPEK